MVLAMAKCPKCGNNYPDPFRFCPVDGGALEGAKTEVQAAPPGSVVRVRTILLGTLILLLAGVLSLTGFFMYQYLKPKFGALVVKTTPAGATIFVNGQQRGVSPLTVGDLRTGGYQIKAAKEGYKDFVQQVQILPWATENAHFTLEPLVPQLSNEQLAEVEAWRKKLDAAQKENILLPPPEDYNVLFFANKILAIDPANAYAIDVKNKLAESVRRTADLAYAREDWLEAEKQYKSLAAIFPDDISINERLTDIASKIDESVKDREKQIEEWKTRADAALKAGILVPPDKDNALDCLRNILRLDRKSEYARSQLAAVKEQLQNRGDNKLSAGDFQGARGDFRTVLQYFPEDGYSKTRLAAVEARLAELAQAEQQRLQRLQRLQEEEQRSRQQVTGMRQTALNAFRSGAFAKAVADWQEYLKVEPNSDEALYYLGASYMELRQYDTAILNFERAIALNPSNAGAHLNLGLLYDRHRNDLKQAIEHLQKARELGGTEKYTAERLQTIIQDLQGRIETSVLRKTPFAAEHKHTFSACKGVIRLTEDGVEYRTTETDHSFFEPWSNLRSLAVEGDDVSLRTRTNKKYNFHLLGAGLGIKIRQLAAGHVSTQE
jgi:tetratricopeptide (TPR) repeat protein